MPNLTPDQYRQVAISEVDIGLDIASLKRFFVGREAYRRTRFIVVRNGRRSALIEVTKASEEPLFSPIDTVRLVAGPDDVAFVEAPGVDTAIPSQLAEVARVHAPSSRCVVVVGLYEHLSFIVDPEPIELIVRDVIPPSPAKLVDQVSRLLQVSEDLPPIIVRPDVVDLEDLMSGPGPFLLPCAGAGAPGSGREVSYLDQRPEKKSWTMVGCARSQQIHKWFYGEPAPAVDFCPRGRPADPDGVILTKCCMQEYDMESRGNVVYVPWGATLELVLKGIERAVQVASAAVVDESPVEPSSLTGP